LRDLITAKNLHINFILEARVVRSDDTWMSPAYGRETVQIGAYTTFLGDKQAWFDGAAAIFADYGGRPHWGKELAMDGERLRSLYPRAGDCLALAKELDPAGVFWSPFLEQVFCGNP
jgi:FAD/FMN-containing dehydrogenase